MVAASNVLQARRHSTYGSYPWGIFDQKSDDFIEVERVGPEGEFRGFVRNFRLKRDAVAAIKDTRK